MGLHHGWFVAAGAAGAAAVSGLASSGYLHKAAVAVTTCGMRICDAVNAECQSVADDAADAHAAARRQAKIDAAVKARLDELEAGIRKEVTEQVDSEGAEA
ncbi:MAG: DUF1490 domain-containing protein [Olsenella sp.]|nr:DUF1490 domain-containing protein [Olsenella sp.]